MDDRANGGDPMSRRKEEIPGARKSALLLLSMPQATAAKVLAHLDEDQVAEIATEIHHLVTSTLTQRPRCLTTSPNSGQSVQAQCQEAPDG